MAYDKNNSTIWSPDVSGGVEYIGYKFPSPVSIKKLSISTKMYYPLTVTTKMTLIGSNDNFVSDIHEICSRDVTWNANSDTDYEYNILNRNSYSYYKVMFDKMFQNTKYTLWVSEINMYGND